MTSYPYQRRSNRWIGHGSSIKRPPRTPGLILTNLSLWGYVKDSVLSPASYKLKMRTKETCANFESEIMHNLWNEVENLLDVNQATHADNIEF